MIRIAWQTLRSRRATLTGAFIATLLAVTLTYATGQLMAGALDSPGPGRFAAADAVVRADPSVTLGEGEDRFDVDAIPGPRLPLASTALVAGVDGVAHAVGDVASAVGVFDERGRAVSGSGVETTVAHGWPSAELTPYRLSDGRPPATANEIVADARLEVPVGASLDVVAAAGERRYRVTGVVDARAARGNGQAAVFATAAEARSLSGSSEHVNAVGVIASRGESADALQARLHDRLGPGVEVLDAANAAKADAGDVHAGDRVTLIAIFVTMGGIAGSVALFVVTGALGLAVAQRRRETAVLRALGATPSQVRRLIAAESLIVSLVAGVVGVVLGAPLASALAQAAADHGLAPLDFEPGNSLVPLVAALGMGVALTQLAVVAAARRAGRIAPAEALREVAIEHVRPGFVRVLTGVAFLAGRVAIAVIFTCENAIAFAVLSGLSLAIGIGLLGPWVLGIPAAALARPLRCLGAPGLLASMNLSANRWRSAALAMPVVLILVLAGSQAVTRSAITATPSR
jgi:putative ABC transport system permease protein